MFYESEGEISFASILEVIASQKKKVLLPALYTGLVATARSVSDSTAIYIRNRHTDSAAGSVIRFSVVANLRRGFGWSVIRLESSGWLWIA